MALAAAKVAAQEQFLIRRVFYRGLARFATDSAIKGKLELCCHGVPTLRDCADIIRKAKGRPHLGEPA